MAACSTVVTYAAPASAQPMLSASRQPENQIPVAGALATESQEGKGRWSPESVSAHKRQLHRPTSLLCHPSNNAGDAFIGFFSPPSRCGLDATGGSVSLSREGNRDMYATGERHRHRHSTARAGPHGPVVSSEDAGYSHWVPAALCYPTDTPHATYDRRLRRALRSAHPACVQEESGRRHQKLRRAQRKGGAHRETHASGRAIGKRSAQRSTQRSARLNTPCAPREIEHPKLARSASLFAAPCATLRGPAPPLYRPAVVEIGRYRCISNSYLSTSE